MAASDIKTTRISKSIIFKSILLLIVSMSLIIVSGTAFFTQRQLSLIFEWSHNNNSGLLQQASMTAHSEMQQFGSTLELLAKTSAIQSMIPDTDLQPKLEETNAEKRLVRRVPSLKEVTKMIEFAKTLEPVVTY